MKVLIIQQKMIGDVLATSILFEAIKHHYPGAELHYVINTHTFPVVENNPFIDKFIFITPEIEDSKTKFFKFLRSCKRKRYDALIDVYGKFSSALISAFTNASTKSAYHKTYTSFIYSDAIKRIKNPQHNASLAVENRMRLLECLDIPFKLYSPKIYLMDLEIEQTKSYLEKNKINLSEPLYMISVLGSSAIKTYPAEYMARLLDFILATKPNAQILFNYIPKQEKEAKVIFDLCIKKTQQHIFFNVFGNNLREFLSITQHCTALIGNEGGANNMAKALNIPTFTIFSPYLNKENWFGDNENDQHTAVHLADYMDYDIALAKKTPLDYYLKFKPELLLKKLDHFLTKL